MKPSPFNHLTPVKNRFKDKKKGEKIRKMKFKFKLKKKKKNSRDLGDELDSKWIDEAPNSSRITPAPLFLHWTLICRFSREFVAN